MAGGKKVLEYGGHVVLQTVYRVRESIGYHVHSAHTLAGYHYVKREFRLRGDN